jgi:tetratricopeptide (TPR) repeat protein
MDNNQSLNLKELWDRVNQLKEQKRFYDSIDVLKQIIIINPMHLSAYNELSNIYRSLFEHTRNVHALAVAAVVYETALGIRKNLISYRGLAAVECERSNLDRAKELCSEAKNLFGEDSHLFSVLGRIACLLGDPDAGRIAFKRSHQLRIEEQSGVGENEIQLLMIDPGSCHAPINDNGIRAKDKEHPILIEKNKAFNNITQTSAQQANKRIKPKDVSDRKVNQSKCEYRVYDYGYHEIYEDWEKEDETIEIMDDIYSEENYNYYLGDDDWEDIREQENHTYDDNEYHEYRIYEDIEAKEDY